MRDNQIMTLLIQGILAGEAAAGITGTPIKQAFQPTKQGANSEPTAYIHKISDRRIGSMRRKSWWDVPNSKMVHEEMQQMESMFQVTTLSAQNPSNTEALTASDLANAIAYILQSTALIQFFQDNGLGILRISEIRNPFFEDDKGRNEASPSFDILITHKNIVTTEIPMLQSTQFQTYPI